MHPYSIDSNERKRVYGILGFLSVAVTFGVIQLPIPYNYSPWYISVPPTPAAVYAFFCMGFNKWGWKKAILRRITMTKVPDLNGIWIGYLRSSYDKYKEKKM